jgi:hypothetical protein
MSTYDRAIARWEGEGGGPRFVAQPDGQRTDLARADCAVANPSARAADLSSQTHGAKHVSDAK